jgi:hypothetical protein
MFDGLSVRRTIEGRSVVVGAHEHTLQVIGVTEHADGGAKLVIAISGSTRRHLHLDVSEAVLQDPIALRQRVVYFVTQLVTDRLTPTETDS